MRKYGIGTGLVILGSVLALISLALGFSNRAVFAVCIVILTIGFVVQMCAAFEMRASFKKLQASFEKQQELEQRQHAELMERVRGLPPEEADKILCEAIDSLLSKMNN